MRTAEEQSAVFVRLGCGPERGKEGRTREVKAGAKRRASVEWNSGSCFVQDCNVVLCFWDVGAVAEGDWAAVAEDAVSVTEGKHEETRVMNRLQEAENGELGDLHSGFARDV